MKRFRIRRGWVWRSLPGLIALTIMATAVLAPAVSGAAAFLTKKKGDKRYLQNTTVVKSTTAVPDGGFATISVACPAGYQAVGGGAEAPTFANTGAPYGMIILESKPTPSGPKPTSWEVEVYHDFSPSGPLPISAVAVCSK